MTPPILRASGTADAAVAWSRYAEPARWPIWSPQIRRVEAGGTRITPGLRGRVVGPLGVAVQFVVETVDESAMRWSWRVRVGPITVRMEHDVEQTPDGCRTSLRMHGPSPILLAYAPVAALALRRLVAA